MGKIKRAIKHNKVVLVLGIILILCFLVLLYTLVKYFYNGLNGNSYGDRLENISEYKLDKDIEDKVKDIYTSDAAVGEIKLNVQGKIIYITIDYVKGDKNWMMQKSLALKIIKCI